ncbi:Serine/threonine protein phosphatase PrpC [Lachnospiraceae bacterium XBB2008]|nr:Serine/threonine protein phosphatase PrpC [Lachnospiraceae bacterium XBB2008]
MTIDYYVFSDKGEREYNEDYTLVRESTDGFCFAVNDGLGGCGRGEVASELVASVISDSFDRGIKDDFIESSFVCAQNTLEKKQDENNTTDSMKTTSVLLILTNGYAQWGHIGDSRLYLFKGTHIKVRTLDHSVPQMLVSMKEIKEKDIRFHRDRNKLLKAIGNRDPNLTPTISKSYRASKGMSFLMCTDGFWELIYEKEMAQALKRTKTAREWVDAMSAIVLERGKGKDMDNASAIGVRIL